METVLIGFATWLACALVCLILVVSICRSGRLEDQWALATGKSADPVHSQAPAPDLPRAASVVHPRSALDDATDAPFRASVSTRI
jgi:hypothetical protein